MPFDDYRINYRNGIISLNKNLFYKYSLDTNRIYDLKVEYDLFPYNFKDEYSNFDIIIERDTITGDTIQIAVQRKDFIENIFEGTELEKSGSIFRGFTFGNNRDLTVNSGFNLQMNGRLSKDVELVAALTDENTPIQPEGTTQKLQELDKVFIQLRTQNVTATLGDIDVAIPKSDFLNFKRKIQGINAASNFDFGDFSFTGAVSKGKFNSNSFNGNDGVQGPYRLIGADNEINILVLSGTEKVYIDGILMTRGEQQDYVIDYGLGQITFTNRRQITNTTRIVVDFEYSDRKYNRTLITTNNRVRFLRNKFIFGASYLNEYDNEDRTIDFTLSESDKEILRNAGADKLKATKSGAEYVGVDSTGKGKGAYMKVDTTINGSSYTFYRFAPGTDSATYQVTFSFVGQGNGDYSQISIYQYDFVGIKQGSYAPLIFLPIPTSYQILNLSLSYASSLEKEFFFDIEGAYSYYDKNKFSTEDKNNGGVAFSGVIGISKNNFKLLGMNVRNLEMHYKQRIINKLFNTLDRINVVEFSRNFDTQDSSNVTEDFREANLIFSPAEIFNLKGNFAQLKRGDYFNSYRTVASVEFNALTNVPDTSGIPRLKYTLETISSENNATNNNGFWIKHNAYAGYRKYFGKPFFDFVFEYKQEIKKNKISNGNQDSLTYDSFGFLELLPSVSINNLYDFTLSAGFDYRKDDIPFSGVMGNLSNSFTQKYSLSYYGLNWFSTMFEISVRERLYSEEAKNTGNANNRSVLVNWRTRFDPFKSAVQSDLFYYVTSERTAKVEKLFVAVPKGQGNYIYLGDLNSNGIQDENEFQLVNYDGDYIKLNLPTDQYFPTVDLKTSARIILRPSRYYFMASDNIFAKIYNNFSSETYYRIDEKSKDPNTNNLYFLKLSSFLNDSNTLAGSQLFQQDVFLFENNPSYSFRFRFLQQKGFSQYSSGNERYLNIQRSLRIKIGLTSDLAAQMEYMKKTDNNAAPPSSVRNREILSDGVTLDLTYKPINEIESGFLINYTRATDSYPKNPVKADINQQILRFIYSFATVGRLRIEFERNEIGFNTVVTNFPYELTSGRPDGKSWYWRANLDYSISKNIQATINYDGRVEGKKQVIHTGRAQVTAFF
ncbi:MAG: hypothetical protein FJ216_10350 [Ignavibacteria bacterium]|nr:hypothetical protein [Ignavibacteria bacterium]